MKIHKATYLISSPNYDQCLVLQAPEYAFIGRSNVGKSSIINAICGQKGLAKTSSAPGKTQLINHFEIISNEVVKGRQEKWYIVDLPGYGYAKVSKSSREKWEKFIRNYITKRESLQCVFVLIDSRLEPQKIDLEFCSWLGECQIPFALVYTKADKQSGPKTDQNVAKFNKALLGWFEEMPPFFVTSAEKAQGKDEVLNFIKEVNEDFVMPDIDPQFYNSSQSKTF